MQFYSLAQFVYETVTLEWNTRIHCVNVHAHRIQVALKTFFNETYVQFGSFVNTLSKDKEIICNFLDLMDSNESESSFIGVTFNYQLELIKVQFKVLFHYHTKLSLLCFELDHRIYWKRNALSMFKHDVVVAYLCPHSFYSLQKFQDKSNSWFVYINIFILLYGRLFNGQTVV